MVFNFTEKQGEAMGAFVAQLVREGIKFETRTTLDGWQITLTGGF